MLRDLFEWDEKKEVENTLKHGIDFKSAAEVFFDERRIIVKDEFHSESESRLFCIGATTMGICTVRFVCRDGKIRFFGAGVWRKGKKIYEKENKEKKEQ